MGKSAGLSVFDDSGSENCADVPGELETRNECPPVQRNGRIMEIWV